MNSSARAPKARSLTESEQAPEHWTRVRSFKRRGKRITPGQQQAYDQGWDQWGISDPSRLSDLNTLFAGLPVVMEIGFGMGEATAELAAARRDLGVLAVDIHRPGIGALLREVRDRGLNNLRIVDGDVLEILGELAPAALAGVRIFFPDPWPKKRHHKRRLIEPTFIKALVTKIEPGGFLHVASDWEPYAQWIREVLDSEPALDGGEIARPLDRPLTRFEKQGISKGHRVTDLYYRRRA